LDQKVTLARARVDELGERSPLSFDQAGEDFPRGAVGELRQCLLTALGQVSGLSAQLQHLRAKLDRSFFQIAARALGRFLVFQHFNTLGDLKRVTTA